MRRSRFAILTVVMAMGVFVAAAAPAPAGLPYSWTVTPSEVRCVTTSDNVTAVSVTGPVTADLPASPPAVIGLSYSIDGGGSLTANPNDPTFGIGYGTALPSTTTVVITLTVDGNVASVQTLQLICGSASAGAGTLYLGTFASNTVINGPTPPSGPTDTPVADAVNATPRVTG